MDITHKLGSMDLQNIGSSIDTLLEYLSKELRQTYIIPETEATVKDTAILGKQDILIEEDAKKQKPDVLLYEFFPNTYYLYVRKKEKEEEMPVYEQAKDNEYLHKTKEEKHTYGLFIPAGVVIRRVPQNILGDGVLGRAFIHQNYIEVLDSLLGNEYTEVLAHEVFHIVHPYKSEKEIRMMTKNYVGEKAVYH